MANLVQRIPHVAILMSRTRVTHTQILRGILSHIQRLVPWTLDVRLDRDGEPTSFDEAHWNYDGIIAARLPDDLLTLVRRHRTPMVLLNDIGPTLRPMVRVRCDNDSVARMAIDFFVGHGFTRFAYLGATDRQGWSLAREDAFSRELAARGLPCDVYPDDGKGDAGDAPRLRNWLLALPKPVALFAAYDVRARSVLDVCAEAGIAVPGDIAVLGVDNDDVLCETASPTLSSIAMTTEEAGFRAAEALDVAMASRRRARGEPQTILYAAKAVVERRSTARDATRDALVRRCRDLIEANVSRHFGVADLARSLGVSRRTLETRFRTAAGRSVGEEITEHRIRRAKALLAQRTMSQSQIAEVCGFTDASHMNVVFRRRCGAPPGAFR